MIDDVLGRPFVGGNVLESLFDAMALVMVAVLVALILLALVRHGDIKAPWAKRLFLDPVDEARARRAALESGDGERPELPHRDVSEVAGEAGAPEEIHSSVRRGEKK